MHQYLGSILSQKISDVPDVVYLKVSSSTRFVNVILDGKARIYSRSKIPSGVDRRNGSTTNG